MLDPKDVRTFDLNSKKLIKHFQGFCKEMGMNSADWTVSVFPTPPKMMEGISVKRLNAEFTNINTGKVLHFHLGYHHRFGYRITNIS